MQKNLIFQSKIKTDLFEYLKRNQKRNILSFLNQHDLYQFNKEKAFSESLTNDYNLNFIDGFTISLYLSILNFKRTPRIRGPTFTRDFLTDKKLSGNKKHFFIVPDKNDLIEIKKKFPYFKKVSGYNPSYIKGIEFSEEEIEKISKLLNKEKPDFVWIGIASPKQNILSKRLFEKTNVQYFVNIGAALDFLLGKKEEAPLIIRELGIEWLYRLITDFKYTRKKVWRSFIGLKYLKGIKLEI